MNEKVLFVDDEPHVLQSYQRNLRKVFPLQIATGGEQALNMISDEGPYAVVVSDMRMPGMTGLELLTEVKARAPDTVRIMLTGNNDQQTAVDAVNEGDVFKFLTKPCPPETLVKTVNEAFEHHKLVTMERKLLKETLHASLRVLTQVLALVNPEAFGRTERLERFIRDIGESIGYAELWELETLALLSQIGCVILPEGLLKKVAAGHELSEEETQLYSMHPCIGSDLIIEIPRMKEIANCIRYQEKNFDGSGSPRDALKEEKIPLGARILKAVLDFDKLQERELNPAQALKTMKEKSCWYDPKILAALEKLVGVQEKTKSALIPIEKIEEGMIFGADVFSHDGLLLVCKGQETTPSLQRRLITLFENGALGDSTNVVIVDPAG